MSNAAFVKQALLGLGVVMGLATLAFSLGYRYNVSDSYPTGLYKLMDARRDYQREDLVLFCPPNNNAMTLALARGYLHMGTCEGGFTPVIKKIMALEGDAVSFEHHLVHINGHSAPSATVLSEDSLGRPLPQLGPFTVQTNEYFMMSDHRPVDSFDSRYYGPITQSHLLGLIEPVFTW